MFRSCLFRLLAVPFVVLLMLVVYESYAVMRARSRTPPILAAVAERPLRLADLPADRRAWLLAVEDPGFYGHHGFDLSTPGAGVTTITQALVKRLYFDHFTPGFAKIEQSLIARFVLDPAMSKDDQLELFLNQASFGTVEHREVIGFPAAARAYYGRDLAQLNDAEYLTLVGMLMAPNTLDPRDHPLESAERVRRIRAMLSGKCRPASAFDVQYAACA